MTRVRLKCCPLDPSFIDTIEAFTEDDWFIEFDETEASEEDTFISVTEADAAILLLLEPKGLFELVEAPDRLTTYSSAEALLAAALAESATKH